MKPCLILGLFLSFILSATVQAQQKCHTLFSVDYLKESRIEANSLIKKVLHGNQAAGEKEVYFYWHTSNPSVLKKVEGTEKTYNYTYSNKKMVLYRNNPDELSAQPFQAVGTFMGRQDISNAMLLKEFINNYGVKAPPDVIKEIETVEKAISDDADVRQSFGYVATAPAHQGGTMLGTFRVFNGTVAHSNTAPELPSERSFEYRGIQTKTAAFLKELRSKNPKLPIFELGKYSILRKGVLPALRKRTKTLIELYWLRYFIDASPPETIFIVHVDSNEHVRLYEPYGFKILEKIITPESLLPGRETNEYTLMATGAVLRVALEKMYSVASPDIDIILP